MVEAVDLRCSRDPRRLFAKMKLRGERPAYIDVDTRNLIEFTCKDCEKVERRADSGVVRVYHRFNFIGEPIETVHEYADGREVVFADG